MAEPKNTENRVLVSIAPPQVWVNLTSSSCGNVSKKWPDNFAHVSGRLGVGDAADLQRLRPAAWSGEAQRDGEALLDLLTAGELAVEGVWIAGARVEG